MFDIDLSMNCSEEQLLDRTNKTNRVPPKEEFGESIQLVLFDCDATTDIHLHLLLSFHIAHERTLYWQPRWLEREQTKDRSDRDWTNGQRKWCQLPNAAAYSHLSNRSRYLISSNLHLFVLLQMSCLLRLCLVGLLLQFVSSDCPCPDSSLCQPIQRKVSYEKVAFMVSNTNWRSYDYSQLTTIVICMDQLDPQLLCLAHSRQVRLVWIANYDVKQLNNQTARTAWIDMQVVKVKQSFSDGINLDMEDEVATDSDAAHHYTELVQGLTDRLRVEVPGSKVRRYLLISVEGESICRSVSMWPGVPRVSMDVAMITKDWRWPVTFSSWWPTIFVHKSMTCKIVLHQPTHRSLASMPVSAISHKSFRFHPPNWFSVVRSTRPMWVTSERKCLF